MITIILFIIFIVLFLVFIQKYKEKFSLNSIKFLQKKDTCKILSSVSYDYNNLDISLRNIPIKYHNNIYKFYCDHLIDFTILDKKLIKWLINGMKNKIPDKFKFILDNIKLAKYRNFIENGYPHTNKDVIFLTDSFISDILQYYNQNNLDDAIEYIGSIIIHECVHIWQRKEPQKFNNLYKNYWMFEKVDNIYNNNSLKKKIRFNPDGKDTNWIFNMKNKHIYILSIYRNNADNIGHVKYIGVYLEKENNKYIVPDNYEILNLSDVDEFTYFFENLTGNHYHPNEISAELISIYYLKLMDISHHNFTNIGFKNMLIWLNKNI